MWGNRDRMGLQQLLPGHGLGDAVTPWGQRGEGSPCQTQGRLHGHPCWGWVLGSLLAPGPVAEDAVRRASSVLVGGVRAVAWQGWREPGRWRLGLASLGGSANVWRACRCSAGRRARLGPGTGEGEPCAPAVPWACEGSALCSPFASESAPGSVPAPGLSPH